MSLTKLWPAPGLIVLLPDGSHVPGDGAELDARDLFIRRRIADGDLLAEDPAPASEQPAPSGKRAKE